VRVGWGLGMPVIHVETRIDADPQRCFNLARDVGVHQQSTAKSKERAVDGVTAGKLALGETVTWEAIHFGVRMRLTSRITAFDPPRRFVDEMVKGPFHHLRHVHEFRPVDGTLMIDDFDYASPLGLLGRIADAVLVRRYLDRLLRERNAFIKRVAEQRT
jgi:ligand-binding SRPBCC domain-containing protein